MGTKSTAYWLTTWIAFLFIFMLTSNIAFSEVVELSPSQDTFTNSKRANKSYGSHKYVILNNSNRGQREGLIKFDLDQIPAGAEIESAELLVNVTYRKSYRNILTVFEALEDWNESATWSTRPDRASLSDDSVEISSKGEHGLDVTSLVQDWFGGVSTNNGFYLTISNGHLYINSSESSSNQPILRVEYFTSNPEPDEDPAPQDDPGGPGIALENTGVSDAPLVPVDKRIIIVSKDGTGDYSRISDAVSRSQPGDTIQVKDGIYEERVAFYTDGTKELPIALINYPGHSPVIDPGGGEYPSECCPEGGTQRVEIHSKWIIIQGFEIRYGWEGIKIYDDHITIRGNWIHHNSLAGILVVSANDVYIDNNTIHNNGTEEGSCSTNGRRSPKQCHGIYFSEHYCEGMANNTVRSNTISNHGGRAIQWNGSNCGSDGVIRNTLVENNIMENNSWGMSLYYNTQDSLIINNTIVIEDYPETNDTDHTLVGIYGSSNNIFMNNIFQSSRDDVMPIVVFDTESTSSTYDHNLWNTKFSTWVWDGNWRSDFHNYQSISSWDSNGVMDSDPGFFDLSGGDYHINADSLARDGGNNTYCAQTDIDNEPRNASPEDVCDIGADERF